MSDNENMNVKKVYNDMIDEEIDLDEPEDIENQPHALKNQPLDEVHEISDDSRDLHVPSPEDSHQSKSYIISYPTNQIKKKMMNQTI